MGVLTSETTVTQSGTVTIVISSGAITGNASFYITKLGSIQFRNEIPNKDETNVNRIATQQGKLKIECWNDLYDISGGNASFYIRLLSLGINNIAPVTVTINNGTAYVFNFYLKQEGISYNKKTNIITLEFIPASLYLDETNIIGEAVSNSPLISVDKLITDYPSSISVYEKQGDPSTEFALLYSIIFYYLESTFGIKTTLISVANRSGGSSLINSDVLDDRIDFFVLRDAVACIAPVSRSSALLGAFWGSCFNVNYYVQRNFENVSYRVEIDYNRVIESSPRFDKTIAVSFKSRAIYVSADNYSVFTNLKTNTNATVFMSNVGNQEYTVQFSSYFSNAVFNPDTTLGIASAFPSTVSALGEEMVLEGIRGYCKGLGLDGSRRIRFEMRGFDQLKPFNTFTFSDIAPDEIRKAGSDVIVYRVSDITYDLVKNTIKCEAYQIGTV